MDELESDGRRLSTTFDRAMDGVGPELGALVAGAAERGRWIRRRRRAAVTGAVAAVAVLAVGGAVALQPGSGSRSATVVANGTASPSATASASPSAAPPTMKPRETSTRDPRADDGPEKRYPGTGANAGKVALTGHAAVLAVVEGLPRSGATGGYAGYHSPVGWTGPELLDVRTTGELSYDDGKGPVQVRVEFEGGLGALFRPGSYPPGPGRDPYIIGYDDRYNCEKARAARSNTHCEVGKLPDGSTLMLTESTSDGYRSRTADLLSKDNNRITLTEFSGGVISDLRELPLSLEQLKAAVTVQGLQEWITPERADQADQTIRPFRDSSPGRDQPGPGGSAPTASASASASTSGSRSASASRSATAG
ncbi:hypothetical protein J5Y04_35085 [Kitasatospora sp. RG8]|uniref:hypothetical protein n=1 Tax=Kitasatospora sp. RG8 TaxID=2820815 RepID=UPI001ADF5B48|nr:hypothetical protein [Kitasatospora sp. RG8]MBP0454709.1 hypothetical protein [Kitasatospora sp. RG8]